MLTSCLGSASGRGGSCLAERAKSNINKCQYRSGQSSQSSSFISENECSDDQRIDNNISGSTDSFGGHHLVPADKMIHSDNSIYSLINTDHNNNNHHHHHQSAPADNRFAKSKQSNFHHQQHEDSPLSPSMQINEHNNADIISQQQQKRVASNRNLEQHRRLQYQVHQQLQKIYSNKLQEFEQHNQIQIQRQAPQHKHQSIASSINKSTTNDKLATEMIKINHHCIPNNAVTNSISNNNLPHQHHNHHHHHHHNQHQHLYQEQPYDSLSLSPPIEPANTKHHLQHQHNAINDDFYDVQPNRRPSICAIPEECYEGQQQQQQRRHAEVEDEPSGCGHDHEEVDDSDETDDHHHHLHVVDDDKEDLLRTSSDELMASGRPKRWAHQTGGSIDRKKQLESLHYATATAAALLNVTASAAAAFAAVNENKTALNSSQRQANKLAPRPVYSETTYQHVGSVKQQHQHRSQSGGPYQSMAPKYGVQQQRAQRAPPSNRPPIYATASDRADFNQANRRLPRYPAVGNQQQQQQQQHHLNTIHNNNRVNNIRGPQPIYQIEQNVLSKGANMKTQTVPPNMLTAQQMELLRLRQRHMQMLINHQQHQQQQLQQKILAQNQQNNLAHQLPAKTVPPALALQSSMDNMPALAILHHGPKGSPLKVEMITRMPINPMAQQMNHLHQQQILAQQHHHHQQQQQQQLKQQAQQRALTGAPDQRMVFASVNSKASQQGPLYGLIETGDHRFGAKMSGAHKPFIPIRAITSAPSDASGHSHVPLMVDGKLTKPGLLERICRIDLKLFWWSLIIVCVMFIAAVLTITRNVFRN